MKRHLQNRRLPLILIATGMIWLFVLTFLNMAYGHYGWFGSFLEHSQDSWSNDEVRDFLVQFGTGVRERIGFQILPLVLILTGSILGAINQRRDSRRNKSAHRSADNL